MSFPKETPKSRIYPPGTGTDPAAEPMPAAFSSLIYTCPYFKRRKSRLTHSQSVSHVLPPCLSFPFSPCIRSSQHGNCPRHSDPLSLPAHTSLEKKQRVLIYGHFCALPQTQRRGEKSEREAHSHRRSVSGGKRGSEATVPPRHSGDRGG